MHATDGIDVNGAQARLVAALDAAEAVAEAAEASNNPDTESLWAAVIAAEHALLNPLRDAALERRATLWTWPLPSEDPADTLARLAWLRQQVTAAHAARAGASTASTKLIADVAIEAAESDFEVIEARTLLQAGKMVVRQMWLDAIAALDAAKLDADLVEPDTERDRIRQPEREAEAIAFQHLRRVREVMDARLVARTI
jgi:hypothetical protein